MLEVITLSLFLNFGQQLNQRKGVISSYMGSSGRFGVTIDGFGIKYIHQANLTLLGLDDNYIKCCVMGNCGCVS